MDIKAGTKENLREIIEAIRVLKGIEGSGSTVFPEDKEAMAKFTGFGAVARFAFPDPVTGEYAKGWEELGEELRARLSDEEYASAKATTFNAFYTAPEVMAEMHRGLERLGIGKGSIGLEPGCGIGNFIGAAPAGRVFIGVEKDSISGRIAKLLHPDHEIRIEGFQDTRIPDESLDFAIGNVPFAEIKLRYQGQRYALHDYFFLKALDKVRPGGILAFVTSRYTMDKKDDTVRELLAEQADLLAAIRLPGDAFKNQGTKVVTEILFLQRALPGTDILDETWIEASTAKLEGGEVTINNYFQKNPHMVLGSMSVGQGMYGKRELRVRSDGELAAQLHAAIDGLPENICPPRTTPLAELPSRQEDTSLPDHVKEGSLFVSADKGIMQVAEGTARPVMRGDTPMKADGSRGDKRLAALIRLRDRAREVLKSQQEEQPLAVKEAARGRLRMAYRGFVSSYGPINRTTFSERKDGTVVRRMPNLARFRSDPDVYLVMALELYDERTGKATPAAIMERDVVAASKPVQSVDNAKDGLLASLNHLGQVDLEYISSLYGRSEAEIVEELRGLIYFDPALGIYVPADEYLSGDVRRKLRNAEASTDPRTEGNAAALSEVQPEDLVAEEIDVTLGTPWIPAEDVKTFLSETLEIKPDSIGVTYIEKEALWKVTVRTREGNSSLATSQYGTKEVDAFTLVEQALNMRTPTVRTLVPGGPGEKDTYVVDQEATLAAREKQAEVKGKFSDWIFEKPERQERLVRYYNDHFNNIRLREFDGSHLTFPRMSAAITMREHQKAAIWRAMSSGNTLLAHVVGAGKTFTMVASGMEMKRTGLAIKPLYVVPNHMLEQFSREFLVLYPDANILVATKDDLGKDRRQVFKSRIATGEWDGIVMTHSSFEKIGMSPEFQDEFLARELAEYESLLTEVDDRALKGNLTKKIEKMKAAREARLEEMAEAGGKDASLYFDELGVDQIFIDEAHMFKNLETPSKMDRVAGIQTGGSNRAFDLLMKARFLQGRTPGRGLVFATGTPVSNSLGEMYTMMRYLMPDLLRERGIEHFDAWAAAFGEVINSLEISPDGQSLRVNSRFAKFKNLPELLSLFRLSADVQTGNMLKLPIPKIKGGKPGVIASPMGDSACDYQNELVDRYERVRSGGVDPSDDNALKIITDGRKLALDPRLVDASAGDDPDSKVNQLVAIVYEIWQRTTPARSTQLIFSDLGVSETEWGFCVYDDIMEKLVGMGIPREEIASIGDAGTDRKKESLFASVRAGQVRILLGSTSKMGTGTNVQERLCALHHVDPPWRPADIEQREGRILRQGNTHQEVEIYRYVTEGSFDAFMWQTLETKAKFIAQAMAGDAGTRRADDIGGVELSYAEVKSIASGNPAMLVLAEMEMELRQLTLLRRAHMRDQASISAQLEMLPGRIKATGKEIEALEADTARRVDTKADAFVMRVGDQEFRPRKGEKKTARQRAEAALALAVAQTGIGGQSSEVKLGELGGLDVVLKPATMSGVNIMLRGAGSHQVMHISNRLQPPLLIKSLENALGRLDGELAAERDSLARMEKELERFGKRAGVPFASEETYQSLRPMRDRLRKLLSAKEPEPDEAKDGPAPHEEIRGIMDAWRGLRDDQSPGASDPVETPAQAEPVFENASAEAEDVRRSPAALGAPVAAMEDKDDLTGVTVAVSGVAESAPAGGAEPTEEPVEALGPEAERAAPRRPAAGSTSPRGESRKTSGAASKGRPSGTRPAHEREPQRPAAVHELVTVESISGWLSPIINREGWVEHHLGEATQADWSPSQFLAFFDRKVGLDLLTDDEVDKLRVEYGALTEARRSTRTVAEGVSSDVRESDAGAKVREGTVDVHQETDNREYEGLLELERELASQGKEVVEVVATEAPVQTEPPRSDLGSPKARAGSRADRGSRKRDPQQRTLDELPGFTGAAEAPAESDRHQETERAALSPVAPTDDDQEDREPAIDIQQEAAEREHEGLLELEREAAEDEAFAEAREEWSQVLDGSVVDHVAGSYVDSPERHDAESEPNRETADEKLEAGSSAEAPAQELEEVAPRRGREQHGRSSWRMTGSKRRISSRGGETVEPKVAVGAAPHSRDARTSERFDRTGGSPGKGAILFNQQGRRTMTEIRYNVIEKILERGYEWEQRLDDNEIDFMLELMESGKARGARAVTEILKGYFKDDAKMERVLLETLSRFGKFDDFIYDVRLEHVEIFSGSKVVERAQAHYNAALAARMGVRLEDGEIVKSEPERFLREKAKTWAASLPYYQASDTAARAGDPVFPKDLEGLLAPHYSRPDILKNLIRQSVEDMRDYGSFLGELREWGDLEHLDAARSARIRRCYNALMAAGLEVDMQREVEERLSLRADTVTARSISSGLQEKYSQPAERIEAILIEAIRQGKSVGGFIADLRASGELAHLSGAEMGEIRQDYQALAIKRRMTGAGQGRDAAGTREPGGRVPVGQFTRTIGSEGQGASPTHP